MKSKFTFVARILLVFLLFTLSIQLEAQRRVVGYAYTTRSPASIDYTKITHLNLAFENPDDAGNLSYSSNNDQFVQRARANNVKILVSICGGGASNNETIRARYFRLINDANRAGFVSKIVNYVNVHQLDGIDLDLEGAAINADYEKLVRDLRSALPAGKLLTAALSHENLGYNVPSSAIQAFDFLNVMAYDHGWGQAVHHSTYDFGVTSANWWVTNKGLPRNKVVLGVPFYGYTGTTGSGDITFAQILANHGVAAAERDQTGNIYYNGLPTIRRKTQYVIDNGFGGVMIWELGQDATGSYSLLKAITDLLLTPCTVPAQPAAISGNATVTAGSSQTYSISAVSGATSYTWTLPSGWSGSSTSTSITTTAGSTGGMVSVRANNACGAGTTRTLSVTVNTCSVPAQPGVISGNTSVAAGSTQTYSIAAVSGATSYTWTLPSGWSGSSTTTSISTTSGSAGGTISVRANNSCGAGTTRTLSVSIIGSPSTNLALNKPVTVTSVEPGTTFSGSNAVDGNLSTRWSSNYVDPSSLTVDLGATYSINRVKITWEAAFGVNYSIQTSTDGTNFTTIRTVTGNSTTINDWTGLSGTGRYVRIHGTSRNTQWGYSIFELEVYGSAGCTVPAQPGSISGSTNPLSGGNQTYSVAAVSGATSYTWTLPSGWTGSTSTNTISARVGTTGGTISVRANNSCGASSLRTLSVTVSSSTTNLARNKPVTVTSIEPGTTFVGSNAVDGNLSTRWSSNYVDPTSITVDLGANYNINRVKITWEAAFGVNYLIQVSTTGSTFTTIRTVTGNGTLVNDWTGLSGVGRYVRIHGTSRNSQWGYSIFELEVYGTPAAARLVDSEAKEALDNNLFYPNPVKNMLNLKDAFDDNVSVQIMDFSGNHILKQNLKPGEKQIDMDGLAAGGYLLRVTTKAGSKIIKVYKE